MYKLTQRLSGQTVERQVHYILQWRHSFLNNYKKKKCFFNYLEKLKLILLQYRFFHCRRFDRRTNKPLINCTLS